MMHGTLSVVTPSYNQGQYLDDTIRSVLCQDYPTIEYLVMDGGSQDASLDVIRRHADRLAYWTHAPDGGQAAAINDGFSRSTGEVIAWINSDDYFLPGAFRLACGQLDPARPQILVSNGTFYPEEHGVLVGQSCKRNFSRLDLARCMTFHQPGTFFTRRAWELVGPLDVSLTYAFDWDWFVRAKRNGCEFVYLDAPLAVYRIHGAHKTGTGGERRLRELDAVYTRNAGERAAELLAMIRGRRLQRLAMRGLIRILPWGGIHDWVVRCVIRPMPVHDSGRCRYTIPVHAGT